jgi:hypothetical protein
LSQAFVEDMLFNRGVNILKSHIVILAVIQVILPNATIANATTIVTISTPNAIVIAADSKVTDYGSGSKNESVCKVFYHNNIGYALCGILIRDNEGYDLPSEIPRYLKKNKSLSNEVDKLSSILGVIIKNEVIKLKKVDPGIYKTEFVQKNKGTAVSIIFASANKDNMLIEEIEFNVNDDSKGRIEINTIKRPTITKKNEIHIILMGETKHVHQYYKMNKESIDKMPPELAAKVLIEAEIKAGNPMVGPPIDIIKINKNRSTWVACKKGGH